MKIEQVNIETSKEPQFLSKAYKENYGKGIKYSKSIDTSKIDWNKEGENQKKNVSNG